MTRVKAQSVVGRRRHQWLNEWDSRLHAAASLAMWIRVRRLTVSVDERPSMDRLVERIERDLFAARDRLRLVRAAPRDSWLGEAHHCERTYGRFVRDTNRAMARFR